MTWEIWKGFITANLFIILLAGSILFAVTMWNEIKYKQGKRYWKNIGASFVAIFPFLYGIVKAIFSFGELPKKE